MAKKVARASDAELRQRWENRVATGQFSPAVSGIGTIKLFSKAGDAPVHYPRITSLAVLDSLDEDEQWAVNYAQQVISVYQQNKRPIMDAIPGAVTEAHPVTEFDPSREFHLVLSQIDGG